MGMIVCLLAVSEEELNAILENSSQLETILDEDEERLNDIDKAWEGIIYLLSGQGLSADNGPVKDLSRVIFSGQVVDEEQELGMGPAHYLTPAQVKEAAEELAQLTDEQLRSRYEIHAMTKAGIYPNIWDDDNSLEYLLDNIEVLKVFYKTAAEDGNGVITFLS
jgi:hypothetical protein